MALAAAAADIASQELGLTEKFRNRLQGGGEGDGRAGYLVFLPCYWLLWIKCQVERSEVCN